MLGTVRTTGSERARDVPSFSTGSHDNRITLSAIHSATKQVLALPEGGQRRLTQKCSGGCSAAGR